MKPKYKWIIVDEKGKQVSPEFINKTCAAQMMPTFKLNKREVLKIIEL